MNPMFFEDDTVCKYGGKTYRFVDIPDNNTIGGGCTGCVFRVREPNPSRAHGTLCVIKDRTQRHCSNSNGRKDDRDGVWKLFYNDTRTVIEKEVCDTLLG